MRNQKFLTVVLCLIVTVQTSQSQNIAQWRGANRDGAYTEKNLLKTWPESGPKLLWMNEEIGSGFGSPVIAGDKLFVNGEIGGISNVFAFDLNGKLLWKSPNGSEFMGKEYSANFPGARSTPTVYNDFVYACSGNGRIACFDGASGKEKWAVEMVSDLGGKNNFFGYSESPFVDEKYVYCFPGGAETNVAALDKFTGKVVWTSKALSDMVSYYSPIIIKLPKRDVIHQVKDPNLGELKEVTVEQPELSVLIAMSHEYLMGLDAANGKLLWSQKEDSVKREGEHCNTPIYADGFIYDVSGVEKGNGAMKLELSPDGKNVKEVWKNLKVRNSFGGFVKSGDKLYTTMKDNKLKCLDMKTGMVVDSISGLRGSVIMADNQLYCYNDNGTVNLVNLAGPKMELVSKFKIEKGTKEHFSHPVIANGVLYIRHGNALMAYEIK